MKVHVYTNYSYESLKTLKLVLGILCFLSSIFTRFKFTALLLYTGTTLYISIFHVYSEEMQLTLIEFMTVIYTEKKAIYQWLQYQLQPFRDGHVICHLGVLN